MYAASGPPLVLIFNFEHFEGSRLKQRTWTNSDINELKTAFKTLPTIPTFSVHHNLNNWESVLSTIDEIKTSTFESSSALVCIVASHGGRRNGEDVFYTRHGEMLVEELICRFTASRCPALKGKPKIFIFETCRVDTETGKPRKAFEDSGYPGLQLPESHFMIAFATTPSQVATVHRTFGSIFILTLCKVIKEEVPLGGDMHRILTRTNQMIANSTKFPDETDYRSTYFWESFYFQISCFVHSLTKRYLLNPDVILRKRSHTQPDSKNLQSFADGNMKRRLCSE